MKNVMSKIIYDFSSNEKIFFQPLKINSWKKRLSWKQKLKRYAM